MKYNDAPFTPMDRSNVQERVNGISSRDRYVGSYGKHSGHIPAGLYWTDAKTKSQLDNQSSNR